MKKELKKTSLKQILLNDQRVDANKRDTKSQIGIEHIFGFVGLLQTNQTNRVSSNFHNDRLTSYFSHKTS